jgi:hypothetical protein
MIHKYYSPIVTIDSSALIRVRREEESREDRVRRLDVLKGTIVLILVGLTIGL